ncbi:Uncharacterised protein [Cedecea neteri]|uniref:Uncharacterized protein n=1 Tax=Cedecea neteri TaxID=158822 RepID=A0A2X3IXY2_9ENTR|nr:Uncharacterised protein [Cedecea neteri]
MIECKIHLNNSTFKTLYNQMVISLRLFKYPDMTVATRKLTSSS